MSMYVFKDRERKEKLLIKDATERDKGIRYFCPNPNCDARMFLWNLEGEKVNSHTTIQKYLAMISISVII